MLIHRAGPLPQNLPSRNAMAGVTDAFSFTIRLSISLDIPSFLAAEFTDSPRSGSTSSLRTAPGCVGFLIIMCLSVEQKKRKVRLLVDHAMCAGIESEHCPPGTAHAIPGQNSHRGGGVLSSDAW